MTHFWWAIYLQHYLIVYKNNVGSTVISDSWISEIQYSPRSKTNHTGQNIILVIPFFCSKLSLIFQFNQKRRQCWHSPYALRFHSAHAFCDSTMAAFVSLLTVQLHRDGLTEALHREYAKCVNYITLMILKMLIWYHVNPCQFLKSKSFKARWITFNFRLCHLVVQFWYAI